MTYLSPQDYERLKAAIIHDIQRDYFLTPRNPERTVSMKEEILETTFQWICSYLGLNPLDLRSKSKKRVIVEGRFFYYYVCRDHIYDVTFDLIGKYTCKDHATVMYGYQALHDLMETDKNYRFKAQTILDHFLSLNKGNKMVSETKINYNI